MPNSRAYLDHNATTPLKPAARMAMMRALDITGNPSSVHADGRLARDVVENAREQVAQAVGGKPQNVIFTSGATEGLNLMLQPNPGGGSFLVMLPVEHAAALNGHRFAKDYLRLCDMLSDGHVDLYGLQQAVSECPGTPLICAQLANNETGVIQPMDEIGEICNQNDAILLTDAVQAIGRIRVTMDQIPRGAMVVSSHKIGGPQGCGAIIMTEDAVRPQALVRGGGQERSLRAGSENVAAIAGFGAAMEDAVKTREAYVGRTQPLREETAALIRSLAPDAVIFGETSDRLPNTLCFAIPGLPSDRALMAFDLKGISLSSGSACSSGKVRPSGVLKAMGVSDSLARCALRISFGWTSTDGDVKRFADVLRDICVKRTTLG